MVYETLLKNIYRVLNRISYIIFIGLYFRLILRDAYRVLDVYLTFTSVYFRLDFKILLKNIYRV